MAVGKNITRKTERGNQNHFPIILRLLGRISSGGRGEGNGNFGEENQDIEKLGVGKNIKL